MTRSTRSEAPARKRKAAEEEPAPRRSRKVAEEAPAKTRRSRKVEEPAPRRSRKAAEEEPAPRRSRKAAEEVPARTRRSKAAEEPSEAPARKSKRGAKAEIAAEAPAKSAFNPYGKLDAVLDDIEKHIGLSESSMDTSERRLSTGMLMLDIVLGGGLTAGWYTNFGQEQTCKTTGAVTILSAALNSDVPILGYWDYEGCLTYDAKIMINGKQQHLGDLFAGIDLKPYMAFDLSRMDITVDSPCGPQKVMAASYKGSKPITRIELDCVELEGYKHPVLVCTEAGCLEWKYLEELATGDNLVVQGVCALHES